MFKTYSEVRDWLESYIPLVYGKEELGLARIEELLKRLGNPQNKFRSIHVGGTAGKGSTAFYTARLLQYSHQRLDTRDEKVGMHVSPHLTYIGERMQVNGKVIGERRLIRLIGGIKPIVEAIQKENPELTPSYFEILVAASFFYFAQEKVNWAVVEVGLGGTLDATNVLQPEVSVITNVGLDHTEILGDTIEKIAYEKAGIIKIGVPVVTGATGKALAVIKKVAFEKKAELIQSSKFKVQSFSIKYCTRETVGLVVAAIEVVLRSKTSSSAMTQGYAISAEAVAVTFSVGFPGRFEEIEPGVILDGAHNLDKVKALIEFIRKDKVHGSVLKQGEYTKSLVRAKGMTLVLAFKKGKNWKEMVDLLLKDLLIKRVFATEFQSVTDTGKFAAVSADEIEKYISIQYKVPVIKCENSQQAVFAALDTLYDTDTLLVTGSLYLVGEVRAMWSL